MNGLDKFGKQLLAPLPNLKCPLVGSQICLPDEKMALKKALPDGNLALKIAYRTGIWLSKALPNGNWALKITYRTRIWP